jgi:hypothetical protein
MMMILDLNNATADELLGFWIWKPLIRNVRSLLAALLHDACPPKGIKKKLFHANAETTDWVT